MMLNPLTSQQETTQPIDTLTAQTKSVYVHAMGCIENLMDGNILEKFLRDEKGFVITKDFTTADYVVLLTCAGTFKAEEKTTAVLHRLKHLMKGEGDLVVMGCIKNMQPELATTAEETLLPVNEMETILQQGTTTHWNKEHSALRALDYRLNSDLCVTMYAGANKNNGGRQPTHFFKQQKTKALTALKNQYHAATKSDTGRAYIRLCVGCAMRCSYCGMRTARNNGKVTSIPFQAIMHEWRDVLLPRGIKTFVLTGTNVTDYGRDIDTDFITLLTAMVNTEGDFKLWLSALHPRWVIKNREVFFKALASGKIGHVKLPVQSGNNRVLEAMRRGYVIEDYVDIVENIRRQFPSVMIYSDIMTGFPTETEAEFNDSLDLVNRKLFDRLNVFPYIEARGTPALQMTPSVPKAVRLKRAKLMEGRQKLNHPLRKIGAILARDY